MNKHAAAIQSLYRELQDLDERIMAARMLLTMGQTVDRQGNSVQAQLDDLRQQRNRVSARITAKTLEN